MTPAPGDVTLASYQAAADRYVAAQAPAMPAEVRALLDGFVALLPTGEVLEVGSGTGRDAAYVESLGRPVHRTDATPAFLEMLSAAGHPATRLDLRYDDLGGPWAGILAVAVLLHLSRSECADLLRRARTATLTGGVLALALKEGAGEAWSTEKLDAPRHFTFWREPELREALTAAGWTVASCTRVRGRSDDWLHVLAI